MKRKKIEDFTNVPEEIEKYKAENFKTLGFEIYDYTHILSAITMIVLLLVFWWQLDGAKAQVTLLKEIIFFFLSVLLIFFIGYIAENEDPKLEKIVYNFCWLIASLSLFIPAMFDLIMFFINGLDFSEHIGVFIADLASMIFPILASAFFVLALFRVEKGQRWINLMLTGVCFFLFGTIGEIVQLSIELGVEGFSAFALVELITAFAPIAPAAFGFHDFVLLRNYLAKGETKGSPEE